MSVCLITWDGPCQQHGRWHACKRGYDHRGRHVCGCEATSMEHLNVHADNPVPPVRVRPEPIFMKVPRRQRPSYVKRDDTHYWPKYMKRKRGLL